MFVRLMLKYFGDKMSESGECLFNVAGHGEVDFTFLVVPIECDAEIPSSFPVFFNFVVLLKCLDEVVVVSFVVYLMPKSSMTSVKLMGCQSCFQYPGVTLLWRYPALGSLSSSSSCAMMPAWGSPYIPHRTLQ